MTRRVLNVGQPIVETNGTMSRQLQEWQQVVTNECMPFTGAGSPEGVVTAPQFAVYLDTTAAAGSVQYRKMLPDIGGDKSQGWLLV